MGKVTKESVLQVRVDSETKAEAEALFASIGTSVSEAIRMFLNQSIHEKRLPFMPRSFSGKGKLHAYGTLHIYARHIDREQERDAWISMLSKKHDYDN